MITKGNYMVYGPGGERRAAFALESDRSLFHEAENMRALCAEIREYEATHARLPKHFWEALQGVLKRSERRL